ncbi:DUF7483 domain-containing protein [Pseudoxanthomonas indica]|uniref:Putative phage tail protein n=1 Tax=Pseudoxanthomonas indica TaxID=428993 RepID=A0A1T5K0J6_9GAMM|nr:hypothetical protein [Pseudoxanthomonas indica]GGD45667.1 hypothetical protein GCM10007235_16990 [Pseudoxanthomonas indica]SKC57018.1 Putative phage tail protein [Pseudoxanthomonas indica]
MGGKSKAQTIGYWYRPGIHFGLWGAELDAFLEFRGGDRTAWKGMATESGQIYINALNLWGGEASEGGIAGYCDLMLGEADQQPNAWLAQTFGDKQPAWRAVSTLVFKGGRYGAMNPYPKPASFKGRRILKGWDDDIAWYPETAQILMAEGFPAPLLDQVYATTTYEGDGAASRLIPSIDLSAGGISWIKRRDANGTHAVQFSVKGEAPRQLNSSTTNVASPAASTFGVQGTTLTNAAMNVASATYVNWAFQKTPRFLDIVEYTGTGAVQVVPHNVQAPVGLMMIKSLDASESWSCYHRDLGPGARLTLNGPGDVNTGTQYWNNTNPTEQAFTVGVGPSAPNALGVHYVAFVFAHDAANEGIIKAFSYVGTTATPFNVTIGQQPEMLLTFSANELHQRMIFDQVRQPSYSGFEKILRPSTDGSETSSAPDFFELSAGGITFLVSGHVPNVNNTPVYALSVGHGQLPAYGEADLLGMNPAHMIYDSLVSQSMQGEPPASIHQGSFRSAAYRLYRERFGLCTEYDPDAETVEQFRQRICNVIGAQCSRSRVDGLWYLDLIRADYSLAALPILTDDDILDFKEQGSTLDDAVNQISVKWFDPQRKEDRTTAPLQALGAIMAAGGVNAEVLEYPEIPIEPLALRAGQRDLWAKSRPPRRFDLVCSRAPYALRMGTRFRLQAPRRGIGDMVCMVGDIDAGTLRSGAVRMVALQDFYSMPATTYIRPQVPGEEPDEAPQGAPQQRLVELPYVELAATMSHADLEAMPDGVGYVGAIATAPRVGTNFALYTKAEGEEYGEGTIGNWAPAATFEDDAGLTTTVLQVAGQSGLSRAAIGSRVLWEREECRLDAQDTEAGTVTLARGCADTAPVPHAPGTVAYFYEDAHAVDGREYADGEVVTAKLLTRTASQVQDPDEAPTLTLGIVARPFRPYLPGRLRINDEILPEYLFGAITVSWQHRDRLLQADQLVEHEAMGPVAPEPGTTYTVRWYIDGVLDHTDSGVSGLSTTYTASADGRLRIEVEAVRDGETSYQMHVRELHYTVVERDILTLNNEIQTLSSDPIYME